nr:N-6 DNA methylase [Candidatus Sigynarchaeota archaeon]
MVVLETSLVDFFIVDSIAYDEFERTVRKLVASDAMFSKEFFTGLDAWKTKFESLYARERLTERLYLHHALLIAISNLLLATKTSRTLDGLLHGTMSEFIDCFKWTRSHEPPDAWKTFVETAIVSGDDIFNKVYPSLLPQSTKHSSGEYYTPANLAKLMVNEFFVPGQVALDPSCGSGTFVLELYRVILESSLNKVKKKACLDSILGIDKNPLAIFMTRVNLEIMLHEHGMQGIIPKLYNDDALFPSVDIVGNESKQIVETCDLIIGNPPWVVLGGIENAGYKERLKQLAINLSIYVGGKNTSNLEMSSLFLHGFHERVKPGGWMFFILPNSIITGSQNAKVRAFSRFGDVKVWRFTKQPFKIHSVCVAAKKRNDNKIFDHRYPFTSIDVKFNETNDLVFEKGAEETYEPV